LRLFFFPIPQSLSRILSLTTWFSNLWMSSFILEHGGFDHSRKFQHWIDVIMDRLEFMGSFDGRIQTKLFSILWNIEDEGCNQSHSPSFETLKSFFLYFLLSPFSPNPTIHN
jgi:hypothetical protein